MLVEEVQLAGKALVLAPLPVEVDADHHVAQHKRAVGRRRHEGERVAVGAVVLHGAVGTRAHHYGAGDLGAGAEVGAGELGVYLVGLEDAHAHSGLGGVSVIEQHGWRYYLFLNR